MKELLEFLTCNYFINVSVTAWFFAQLLKTLLTLIVSKELVLERMVGAGGMPSAHSAFVCSLAVSMGQKVGWESPEFAICLAFAAVVMYDAMGVRRAAGEQAKMLNKIVSAMSDNFRIVFEVENKHHFNVFRKRTHDDPDEIKTKKAMDDNRDLLKELLGHTPLEVFGGAVLGVLVAFLFPVM